MKHNIQPLSDLEIRNVNGGNGIIAYDPVTGEPFPEENGGNPTPSDPLQPQPSDPAGTMNPEPLS